MIYKYTTSQFHEIKKLLQHFDDGDELHVYNSRTDKTEKFKVQIQKVLVLTNPSWETKIKEE